MEQTRSKASVAMERYAGGEEGAFSDVYDELAPRLHAYLRRMLGPRGAVDDVLQQAFLQLHLSRGRFQPGAKVEPWAYTIARAVAIDHIRREQRRRTEPLTEERRGSEAFSAEASFRTGELSEALRLELEQLSPKLREAFLLVRLEGLTHAEAAEVLGIEETATKVRAHRASSWLRERLARFGAKGDPG